MKKTTKTKKKTAVKAKKAPARKIVKKTTPKKTSRKKTAKKSAYTPESLIQKMASSAKTALLESFASMVDPDMRLGRRLPTVPAKTKKKKTAKKKK